MEYKKRIFDRWNIVQDSALYGLTSYHWTTYTFIYQQIRYGMSTTVNMHAKLPPFRQTIEIEQKITVRNIHKCIVRYTRKENENEDSASYTS